MELIFILEMYLWQRMKERLRTEEGRSLKTEVVRGSRHWPQQELTKLEIGEWNVNNY